MRALIRIKDYCYILAYGQCANFSVVSVDSAVV